MSEKQKPNFHESELFTPDFEFAEKWWRPEYFKLNGRQVDFLGVSHTFDTLLHPVLSREIFQAIKHSSIVLLENAPDALGQTDKRIEDTYKFLKDKFGDPSISKDEIAKGIKDSPVRKFFASVEEQVAKDGRRLAVVDPILFDYDSVDQLHQFDDEVMAIKYFLAIGFSTPSFYEIARDLIKKVKTQNRVEPRIKYGSEVKIGRDRQRQISRRNFLGYLGALAGAGTGLSIFADKFEKRAIDYEEERGRESTPFDWFLYKLEDYRDVAIAVGIDELTKQLRDQKEFAGPITAIYGGGHSKPVKHYCLSPIERQTRYTAYLPYQQIAPPVLRQYRYTSACKWEKIEERKL